MSERSDDLLVEDILDAIEKITRYTNGLTFDQFAMDERTLDAVARNFEIIGEAANRLSDDYKIRNDGINWNQIRGFRNRIVHDYFGIDQSIVWQIIEVYLPKLDSTLRAITSEKD